MDSIFLLGDGSRETFLQHIMQVFNCSYICLWSYWPQPSNFLFCLDGLFLEKSNQPSSSSGSLARRLFDEYRQARINIDDGVSGVPGLAFKNRVPYMELKLGDLQGLASRKEQLQFYQEAGIKIAVFMGCNAGEIELGISDDVQVDIETELKNYFPEDFSRQAAPRELSIPLDQNRSTSSSSSSLRSLSVDSSEYSSLLFSIPSNVYIPEPGKEPLAEQTMRSAPLGSSASSPHLETIQALNQLRSIQFPSIESEDAALTKAMLAVISSPSSSSSLQSDQTLPANYLTPQKQPAFQRYRSTALAPRMPPIGARTRRPNMLNRAITFYRRLSLMPRQEQVQASRPVSSTQLHHMISERRRREKLNESFQALRSLLPPGTKKDKASVLANTTDYLNSLKSQVAELKERNKTLEAMILQGYKQEAAAAAAEQVGAGGGGRTSGSGERVEVSTRHIDASTSEAMIVDLQVGVGSGGQSCNLLDLVISLLEFLKRDENVSLVSIDANTSTTTTSAVDSTPLNRVILRLRIESGGEWNESAFREAVRRVVDDLAR